MGKYPPERLAAIGVIEALRAGIPTRACARALPDLRPALLTPIRRDLQGLARGERPPGWLVWGEYGQGKSHLLTEVEHLALERGFAVSRVTLSREVSCHHLFNFYRHAAAALRLADSAVPGLEARLSRQLGSERRDTPLQRPDRYCHRLPAIVLETYLRTRAVDSHHDLYDELVGSRGPVADLRRAGLEAGLHDQLPGLRHFRLAEHAPAYFGVLADACLLCGCAGWVLLIDEVELVGRLGKVSRLKVYENLDWLLNWSGDNPYPIYVVGAVATSLQEFWTRERGRFQPDPQAIPEMAEQRGGPGAGTRLSRFFRQALDSRRCQTLAPVRREQLGAFLEEIVRLHGVAHGWRPPDGGAWVQQATAGLRDDTKLRLWVRLVLEALDLQLVTGRAPAVQAGALSETPIVAAPEHFRPDPEGPSDAT